MVHGTAIRLAEERDVEAVAKLASRWENEGVTYGERATALLEVQNLYVAPEHRSRSVGGRLLEAVLAEGEREGIERSILFTGATDASAVVRSYSRMAQLPAVGHANVPLTGSLERTLRP